MAKTHITIDEFLRPDEIERAAQLRTALAIHTELILPNIRRIELDLDRVGDVNSMYLAYAVEYVVSVASEARRFPTRAIRNKRR